MTTRSASSSAQTKRSTVRRKPARGRASRPTAAASPNRPSLSARRERGGESRMGALERLPGAAAFDEPGLERGARLERPPGPDEADPLDLRDLLPRFHDRRLEGSLLRRRLGEIALARTDGGRLGEWQISDVDDVLDDRGERTVAPVLDEPDRPAHSCRGIPSRRPELALRGSPQLPNRCAVGRDRARSGAHREVTAHEGQYRHPVDDRDREL